MPENKQGNVPRNENTELCGVENIQNYSFFIFWGGKSNPAAFG